MRVYIETYGCQMNDYDSRMIGSMLVGAGHTLVRGPSEADAVIVNTCSVRERAERRVLGRLRHLRGLMPDGAILGVVGCVAQRLGDRLPRAARGVDFVIGTDQYYRLPDALEGATRGNLRVEVEPCHDQSYDARPAPVEASICDFVSVMRGCDNYCSYCVVPYVRGRERSRPVGSILEEISSLVALGTRDVTLIGQNVNSYADGAVDFAGLLERADAVPGLGRIRFATSHPKDLSNRRIDAVRDIERVCEHVHLPVQSGADRVLEAMNRSYGREEYLALVRRVRERIEGAAITTDIIVGFPGESEDDFRATLSLMEEIRFDSAFMFRYSVREGTRAAALPDDVPEATKIARLETVIATQRRITEEVNRELEGTVREVLVGGPSEKNPALLFGRTRTAKAVVFGGPTDLAGSVVATTIEKASAWTLRGRLADDPAPS